MIRKIKRNLILWGILMIVVAPTVINLFHKGFFPTHDFIYVARIEQMYESLRFLQLPVRWVADFRYGEPTFNFYAPLPYYAGALIHLLGVNYLVTSKLLFSFSIILSFVAIYRLGYHLYGKIGGIISGVLYIYAPYRSVDIFVRGALSEAWAFIFFPIIILYTLKMFKYKKKIYIPILALCLAGLYYSHNIMTLLFLPFWFILVLYLVTQSKNVKKVVSITTAFILSLLLGASYLFPALIEKKYIQASYVTAGYFDFAGHFVAIRQWFSRFWGYGASLWGPVDDMSFQLGITHWIFILFVCGFVFYFILTKRFSVKKKENTYLVLVFIILFVFSLFLQHNQSTFLWKNISLLAYTQFPWRFLAISVLFSSIIAGYTATINNKFISIILPILIITTVLLNMSFFRPEKYYNDSVDEHYVGQGVYQMEGKLPKDYISIWTKKIENKSFREPIVLNGEAEFSNTIDNGTSFSFSINSSINTKVKLPISFFPGWVVKMNNAEKIMIFPDDYGLITFDVPQGRFDITAKFTNTPIRLISNIATFFGILVVLFLFITIKNHDVKNSEK